MAKQVDQIPDRGIVGSQYPWDEWLNGKCWLLEPDQDFFCKPRSMEQQIRAAAAERGKKTHVRVRGEGVYVTAWDAV